MPIRSEVIEPKPTFTAGLAFKVFGWVFACFLPFIVVSGYVAITVPDGELGYMKGAWALFTFTGVIFGVIAIPIFFLTRYLDYQFRIVIKKLFKDKKHDN